MWTDWSPCALLLGVEAGAANAEKLWRFLAKLNTDAPCDPAAPLLGVGPKELNAGAPPTDACTPCSKQRPSQ